VRVWEWYREDESMEEREDGKKGKWSVRHLNGCIVDC
jgi:hypothetical protein